MVMLSISSLLKERFGHPNINPSPPLLKVVEEVWSSDNTPEARTLTAITACETLWDGLRTSVLDKIVLKVHTLSISKLQKKKTKFNLFLYLFIIKQAFLIKKSLHCSTKSRPVIYSIEIKSCPEDNKEPIKATRSNHTVLRKKKLIEW